MKKITIFHTEFFFSGGAEHTLLETIDFLKEAGYTVTCFAPYVNKQTCFPDIIDNYCIQALLPTWILNLKLPRDLYIVISAILFPLSVGKFRDSDLFYGANQAGPFFAYLASVINKKPYLVYMPYPQGFLYPRKVDTEFKKKVDINILVQIIIKIAKPLLKKLDFVIMSKASAVITEGTYSQNLFEKIYRRKFINCPPGAAPLPITEIQEIDRFNGQIDINNKTIPKPYLLLTNRHMPKKKFEYAIKIMSALKYIYNKNKFTLVITGAPTPYTDQLKDLIRLEKVEENVIFTGYTSEADTSTLYKNAAVYIYPAPEEDFGKGIIQAMACGVPVIAWNNAGPTGIIKDKETGYLITPFNEESFAEKTNKLLTNQALNQQMGITARSDVVNNFSQQKHIQSILKTITEIA